MSTPEKPAADPALETMIDLIRKLRSPSGCPWDRKQTPRSIVNYLVEEVYELVDAIDQHDDSQVLEELGDVLFQVLFIAEMYAESRRFELDAVIRRNVEKMRHRHPHVFGDAQDLTPEEIRRLWHEIKKKEKPGPRNGSALDSIPRQLPALTRAYRMCERVARTGIDRLDLAEVLPVLEYGGRQFQQAASSGQTDRAMSLLGAMLFATVQAARIARIHPDTALKKEVDKFERRFRRLETGLAAEGKLLDSCSETELQRRWRNIAADEGDDAD